MIQLSEKWFLTSGPADNDFCLVEKKKGRNRQTGEETVTEVKTYHPSIEMVSKKVAKSECIEAVGACETLKEIMEKLEEVRVEVFNACQK